MSMKKKILISSISLMAIAIVVLGSMLGVVCHKVKSFDRKHGSDVFANLSSAELYAKTNAVKKVEADALKKETVTGKTE